MCYAVLHMLLLLIVIEPNHGKVARFLESDNKNRMLKSANAESETDGILPPRLGGGVRLGDRGLIALAAYH